VIHGSSVRHGHRHIVLIEKHEYPSIEEIIDFCEEIEAIDREGEAVRYKVKFLGVNQLVHTREELFEMVKRRKAA
jgi:hypothetical protein